MRCGFPACDQDSSHTSPEGVSFYRLPEKPFLRAAWLQALGKATWNPESGTIVCSKHFLTEDFVLNRVGHQLRADAVPEDSVRVCRICLATEGELQSMMTHKFLNRAYETLTGLSIADEEHLPMYLCIACSDQLMNCVQFRNRTLRTHLTLLDIVKNHGSITLELVQSVLGIRSPNSCNPANPDDDQSDNDLGDKLEEVYKLTNARGNTRLEDITIDDMKTESDYVIDQDASCLENSYVDEVKRENNLNNQDDINCRSSNVEENVVVDEIQAGDNDNVVQDNLSVCSSKLDEDIFVDVVNIGNDDSNDDINEVTAHKSLVFSASLYEETVCVIRSVKCDLSYEGSAEDELSNDYLEYGHSFIFVGEDIYSKYPPLQVGNKTTKRGRQPRKGSKNLKSTNIEEQESPGVGDRSTAEELRCDTCLYRTNSVFELLEHLKAHAAPTSYNCAICHYRTVYKRAMISHKRLHTDKKRYSCKVCKKSLTTKGSLTVHMRIHSGERPYACYICKKGFYQSSHLRRHINTHLYQKFYLCNICEKIFSDKRLLQRHRLTVHCVV